MTVASPPPDPSPSEREKAQLEVEILRLELAKATIEVSKLRTDADVSARSAQKVSLEILSLDQQLKDRRQWYANPTFVVALMGIVIALGGMIGQNFFARAQEERLRAQIAQLQSQAEQLRAEKQPLEAASTKARSEIASLKSAQADLETQNTKLTGTLEQIRKEATNAERRLATARSLIDDISTSGGRADAAEFARLTREPAEIILGSKFWKDADNDRRELLINGASFSSDIALEDSLVSCGDGRPFPNGDRALVFARHATDGVMTDVLECWLRGRTIETWQGWKFSALLPCDGGVMHLRTMGGDTGYADCIAEGYLLDLNTATLLRPNDAAVMTPVLPRTNPPLARTIRPFSLSELPATGPLAAILKRVREGTAPNAGTGMMISP